MHPGGASVLHDEDVGTSLSRIHRRVTSDHRTAGQDATEAFYSLHLTEVLERPQYKRLQIGVVAGEEPSIKAHGIGDLSKVPYGEPTWLTAGYFSPYFSDVGLFPANLGDAFTFNPSRTTENSSKKYASSLTNGSLQTLKYAFHSRIV